MKALRSRAKGLGGISGCVVALVAALSLTIAPAGAQAASPVLEFSSPGNAFPIPFEAEGASLSANLGEFGRIVECTGSFGAGEVTGPRSTLSAYEFTGCVAETNPPSGSPLDCESEEAIEPNEILSEVIEAEPVYLNQAKHEVAMLLNPGGGIYMEFECGANLIKASGPFLAPVTPVNQLASSFTAVLERNGNSQIVTEYEDLNGVKHQAIPKALVTGEELDESGVELTFDIEPVVPLEIKAISREEVEAKQRQEDEAAAAKKRQEEEAAAAKKRQADEAAAKKRQEEEAAAAAAKKHQEEVAAKQRAQKLNKALKQCKKVKAKGKRAHCVKQAKKRFGPQKAKK